MNPSTSGSASSLWAGEGYNFFGYSGAHFPPLFPALGGGLALLLGSLQRASNAIYVIAGALLVVPLLLLVRADRQRGCRPG